MNDIQNPFCACARGVIMNWIKIDLNWFQVWDAISGETLHSFQHQHIVKSVAFSTDSSLLVTGSNERLVRLFDLNRPEAGTNSPATVAQWLCAGLAIYWFWVRIPVAPIFCSLKNCISITVIVRVSEGTFRRGSQLAIVKSRWREGT